MSRFQFVLVLMVLVMFLAAPAMVALAQDAEPPLPPGLDIPTPDQIVAPTLATVVGILVALVGSPVTAYIVSFEKELIARLPDNAVWHRLKMADARALSVATAFVLLGTSWLFWAIGARNYFDGFIAFILSLVPLVVTTQTNAKAASSFYDRAIKGHSVLAKRSEARKVA